MTKEDFIAIAKQKLEGDCLDTMLEQIDNFFKIENMKIKKQQYSVGDKVFLKKNMYIHGVRDLDTFDFCSSNGIVSRNLSTAENVKEIKVKNCASLWHIKKNISLEQYILNCSGVEIEYLENRNRTELIPYGCVDKFMSRYRRQNFETFSMNLPMETTFVPNLINRYTQLAFIINGTDVKCKNLIDNNLFNKKFDSNFVLNFRKFYNDNLKEKFLIGKEDGYYDRIAYILFGVPKNMIEGILVGEQFEKDKKLLKRIKNAFPNCYICNLFGKVIK